MTVFGITTLIFAFSTSLALSLVALFILGASDMVSVNIRSSLVQLATPDAMRGRVSAVNALFIGTSSELGAFESGVAAALLGSVPAVALGGIGTLIVAATSATISITKNETTVSEKKCAPVAMRQNDTKAPKPTAETNHARRLLNANAVNAVHHC